jgi:hypothetical protein
MTLLLLAALFGATGCIHLHPLTKRRDAEPLPLALAAQFSAPGEELRAHETEVETKKHYTLRRVTIESTNAAFSTNLILDYFDVSAKQKDPLRKTPVVMLLPISGGNYEPETLFARSFVKRGLSVVLVRRREMSREQPTPPAINAWLEQTVRDNKRVLDWIETRPELDPKRIGLFGISMGGIQGGLVAALDPRIQAATLGLAAGDLSFVLARSTERSVIRKREAYMRAHNITQAQFQAELAKAITCDPSLLAPYIDPHKMLLVLGICDTVVPFPKGWEMRAKMDRPETILIPTGHYSSVVCLPYLEWQCGWFLQKRLR